MRKLDSKTATDAEKLQAAKSGVAGFLAGIKEMNHKIPPALLRILENIRDDQWDDFVLFEEEDERARQSLIKHLKGALKEIETMIK